MFASLPPAPLCFRRKRRRERRGWLTYLLCVSFTNTHYGEGVGALQHLSPEKTLCWSILPIHFLNHFIFSKWIRWYQEFNFLCIVCKWWSNNVILHLLYLGVSVKFLFLTSYGMCYCYELTALSLPKFICWSPTPKVDGIGKWGLWEIIRITWGHDGINALIRRDH